MEIKTSGRVSLRRTSARARHSTAYLSRATAQRFEGGRYSCARRGTSREQVSSGARRKSGGREEPARAKAGRKGVEGGCRDEADERSKAEQGGGSGGEKRRSRIAERFAGVDGGRQVHAGGEGGKGTSWPDPCDSRSAFAFRNQKATKGSIDGLEAKC